MTWNYRVIRHVEEDWREGAVGIPVCDLVDVYTVHEVYYGDEGVPWGYTEEPSYPQGESLEELRKDMEYYARAVIEPVLKEEDFE
jgi:hypothetical protein